MPKALTIDWNLAKVLRAQGFDYEDIAQQVGGTEGGIRSRANREGWNKLAAQTSKVLERAGMRAAAETIKERAPKLAEAWLETMQSDTVERLEDLRKLPKPRNLDDAKKREEMMLTHVKAGRSAFGLDDQKGGGVQINIMSQLAQIAVNETPMQRVAECDTNDATPVSQPVQVVDIEGD